MPGRQGFQTMRQGKLSGASDACLAGRRRGAFMTQLLRSRTFRRPRFLGIVHKRTWPYPATDQRHVRTLHRTLAYALHYDSEAAPLRSTPTVAALQQSPTSPQRPRGALTPVSRRRGGRGPVRSESFARTARGTSGSRVDPCCALSSGQLLSHTTTPAVSHKRRSVTAQSRA